MNQMSDKSNTAWRLTVDEDGHFVCHGWLGPDEMTPHGWRQIEVVAVDALLSDEGMLHRALEGLECDSVTERRAIHESIVDELDALTGGEDRG